MDKPEEELLRDRIVCGVRDNSLRQQFLSKTDLSLANCIDLCRAHEASARQVKDMAGAEKVHVVKNKSKPERITTETPRKPRDTRCERCGLYHESSPEDCPAYNALCLNYGKKGHYARKCRREEMPHDKQKWAGKRKGKVRQFQDDNDSERSEDSEESLMTLVVSPEEEVHVVGSAAARYQRQLFATMVVEGKEVKFQLDTGATCNVLPKEDVPASVKIRQTTQRLTLFSQEDMEAAGKCTVRLVNPSNGKRYKGDFVVVHKAPSSILGAKTVQQMGLISVNHEVI